MTVDGYVPAKMQERVLLPGNAHKAVWDAVSAFVADPTVVVHTDVARRIAVWFISSDEHGKRFAEFNRTGGVEFVPGLKDSVFVTMQKYARTLATNPLDWQTMSTMLELRALHAYLTACEK